MRRLPPVLLWVAALGLLAQQALLARAHPAFGGDSSADHAGAVGLLHGDPYRPTAAEPFVYPPSSALLFLPLAALRSGASVSLALVVVALVVCAVASCAAAGVRRTAAPAVVLILELGSGPGHSELVLGNASVLVAAGLAVALLLLARGQDRHAAVALGLAVALKPLVAPALLVLLAGRRWRPLGLAVALPVALNLVLVPVLHHPLAWLTDVLPAVDGGRLLPHAGNAALAAVLPDHGLGAVVVGARAAVLLAAAVGVAALLVRGCPTPLEQAAAAVLPITAVALASGADERHYCFCLLPLAVAAVRGGPPAARLLAPVGLLLAGLPGSPLDRGGHGLGIGWVTTGQLLVLVAALVVCASGGGQRPGARSTRSDPVVETSV